MSAALEKLLAAIEQGDRAKVKALLKAEPGLAVARTGEARLYETPILHWIYAGDTALHLAAAGGRVEIVKLLLAAGADANAAFNHRRGTPLHYAADGQNPGQGWSSARQVETIRCLLAAGADIDAQDKNGAAALHRAVRHRCAAAVGALLELGANPLLKNKPGSTPFHLAVQNTGASGSGDPAAVAAQRQIIREFLARGISVQSKNDRGHSVYESATSQWIRDLLDEGAGSASK
jgi:ankyrin repeat protein